MAKRVWIVNYYTGTPETQSNPRYIQFARHFMDDGYDVITFNSSLSAQTQDEQNSKGLLFLKRSYGDYKFVHVNAPAYKGNGFARMKSIFSFAWVIKKHCKEFERPDVILHNVHLPFDYPIVWVAKKLRAKYIAEAWDCWPEDFVVSGLISSWNPIMKFAYWIEKKCYYSADALVFTFLGSKTRLKQMGWTLDTGGKIDPSRVFYINNGVDLLQFDQDKISHTRKDTDINRTDIFKIIYVGSINSVNPVFTLIDAAALLKKDSKYQFFIYGNGSKRLELEQKVKENGISNVVFKEKRIPLCEVPWVVNQATVNVMIYEKGFGRWGVSSGKFFQYLAAGKPIVCNVDIKYDNIIHDEKLGVCQDLDTAKDFADAIRYLAEQPAKEYSEMCQRIRKCANRYDYKKLSEEEFNVIQSVL